MTPEELAQLEARVADFFGRYCRKAGDPGPYTLKRDHTGRVCRHILLLSRSLDLAPAARNRAAAAAWLHDTGRFPQYETYHTFSDPLSRNHAALSVKTVLRGGFLAGIDPGERRLVLKAVALHNRPRLPEGLPADLDLLSRMLRDADKMDIFGVMVDHFKRPRNGSDRFISHRLPDDGRVDRELAAVVVAERGVPYSRVRTLNDLKLFQLGMIYDLNYPAALAHVREQGVVAEFIRTMPGDECLRSLEEALNRYMDDRTRE